MEPAREPTSPAPVPALSRRAVRRLTPRALGLVQAAAVLREGLIWAWLECWGRFGDVFGGEARRASRREMRHTRHLSRLAAALGRLKGAFAKAGQFAALRYDALPPAVRAALADLQDRVPPLPFGTIRKVVEEELGGALEDHFAHFEREPLAAASIAQVHRALLPDGREVAVKVQYPWLEDSLPADLAIARGLVKLWARRRGSPVDSRALFVEFARGLSEELDFAREADVAEEIAANLAEQPGIVVPGVHRERSTRRVLTLDYHRGIRITDRAALAKAGVDPAEVLQILVGAYAKQIFVDGLFHADPHPGNLFVAEERVPGAGPRVVFVDFGLARRLDPELRAAMRRGVYALLQRNPETFVTEMGSVGMIEEGRESDVRRSVAAMFAHLAGEGAAPLGLSGAQVLGLKDEAKRLLEETPGLQLPNDLLLWAKTLSYLLAVGQEMAPEVDIVRATVPHLLQFLAARD